MKKCIKKQCDKICLILLVAIGLMIVVLTYIVSLKTGFTTGPGVMLFDTMKFGAAYSTYCINSLVLYSYFMIRILQKYKIQRKTERLLNLDEINAITLPSNSISESVEINIDGKYIRYDLFYDKYNRIIKLIAILYLFVCALGFIPYILCGESINNNIIFVVQILVGLVNILYLVLGELEHSETKFLSIKLNQSIKDCEKKINEKYKELMTVHLQREWVEISGEQPYYVIQYSKINKSYRVIVDFIFAIGGVMILIYTISNGLWNELASVNGLFFTIYPNIILIVFCVLSNQLYYDKILQHKVNIEEYTKEKITEYKEGEINKIMYTTNITMRKKKCKKSYIISIITISKLKSIIRH